MLLNEDISKRISKEKFSLKDKAIIKFEDFKTSVYDELLNVTKTTGQKASNLTDFHAKFK